METQKRTLLKTAIYRGFTTMTLFITSWLYTGSFIESSFITIVFNVVATIFYYVHERMWCKTNWGLLPTTNILNTNKVKNL